MTRKEQFELTLEHVAGLDTSALGDFLRKDFHRPLLVAGSGGSYSACRLVSLMYNAAGGFSRAETPYSINSVSDSSLMRSKLLVVSSSGGNADAQYISKRCCKIIPAYTGLLSDKVSDKNPVRDTVSSCAPGNCFIYPRHPLSPVTGFVSAGISNHAIVYKAFMEELVPSSFDTGITFSYSCARGGDAAPSLADISHFVVLYGSWGEPAAYDIESRFVESGMASVQLSDYRNFCHGRFLFVSNHIGAKGTPADTALVLLVTPREKAQAERLIALLPDRVPVVTIVSDKDSPAAAIEHIMAGIRLFDAAGNARNIDPCNPVSKGGIDKRHPQNKLSFKSEFRKFGALSLDFSEK